MIHFLPTKFDVVAAALIASPAASITRPVECSQPLVESTVIESPHGTVIPLVNWSGQPIQQLKVTIRLDLPTGKVTLASGADANIEKAGSAINITLNIDAADALIFRK